MQNQPMSTLHVCIADLAFSNIGIIYENSRACISIGEDQAVYWSEGYLLYTQPHPF